MSSPVNRKVDVGPFCCITRRKCVIIIAILETIYSLIGIFGFWYASYTYPYLSKYVNIILPNEFLDDGMIIGLINSLCILCGFEFILAVSLLDGAKHIRLGQIRFWLTTMFTYKILTCVLVIGMELAGCKAPEFNAYMLFSIFIRFMEMLLVYIFLEEETLKRLRMKIRCVRSEALSAATSYSNISIGNENDVLEDVCTDPNPEPIINGVNSNLMDC